MAAPHPSDIDHIIKTLLSPIGFPSCVATLHKFRSDAGIDLADILAALAQKLQQLNVPAHVKVVWLEGLAEIEWCLGGGASEEIQTGAVVGVILRGKLLMGPDI